MMDAPFLLSGETPAYEGTMNESQQQQDQNEAMQQADAAAGETPAEQQGKAEQQSFNRWYEALPADAKEMVDGYISGLKSALGNERSERKSLEKRLREIQKQAEEGEDIRAQLRQISDEMSAATAKASFFEAAHAAEVRNLRLAWLAANDAGLIDKQSGEVNFAELRKVAPELFMPRIPSANAGAGAKQSGVAKPGMNDFLRAATGRN